MRLSTPWSVLYSPRLDNATAARVVALGGIFPAGGWPHSVVEVVRYAAYEMGAVHAYRCAHDSAALSPFVSRTVEVGTEFTMSGHGLYKDGYACGISQQYLTQASVPEWSCASLTNMIMCKKRRQYAEDVLNSAVGMNLYEESIGVMFALTLVSTILRMDYTGSECTLCRGIGLGLSLRMIGMRLFPELAFTA